MHLDTEQKGTNEVLQEKASKFNDMVSENSEFKLNWKFKVEIKKKKIFRKNASFRREYLFTGIQESWNHFDKEHCFELMYSIPEGIKAVINAQGRATKYNYTILL